MVPPPPRETRTRWSPFCTSISVSLFSSSNRDSSRTSSGSTSILRLNIKSRASLLLAQERRQPFDGKRVALRAEAADHGTGGFRDIGIVPETFTGVNVADMNLDGRQLHAENRIQDRDRGAVARGVDHDARRLVFPCLLNPVDEFALAVGLAEFDRIAVPLRGLCAKLLDVGKRRAPIYLGLTRAEQVQVRPVDDVDRARHEGL